MECYVVVVLMSDEDFIEDCQIFQSKEDAEKFVLDENKKEFKCIDKYELEEDDRFSDISPGEISWDFVEQILKKELQTSECRGISCYNYAIFKRTIR